MFGSQRKYIKLAFAAIYMMYCGITTFCVHTHIVNGVTYIHHHSNQSQDHGENLAGVILFSSQCSSVEDITITELELFCYLKFIEEINNYQLQSTALQKHAGNFFLRPPPARHSFLG